jgi:HTH-type transcriptional regulator / antitoxin HigA
MYRVIKTDDEYKETLITLESLLDQDPAPGTPENDELELITLLVQDYEAKINRFVPPDPIAAIRFRMEQQGLAPKDLIPYLGSRSKVSEILSGKRALTKSMIRSLQSRLEIPTDILIQEPTYLKDTFAIQAKTVTPLVEEDQAVYEVGRHNIHRGKKKVTVDKMETTFDWKIQYATIINENQQLKQKIIVLEKMVRKYESMFRKIKEVNRIIHEEDKLTPGSGEDINRS